MRRGYILTLDAIMALVVVMALFLVVIGVENSIRSTEKTEFKTINYLSEDTMEVLSKKGVLDQICTEWALSNNNESSAHWTNLRYVVSQYLPRMIPERMGYALYIDGTEVYNDSSRIGTSEAHTLTHSSRVLTGYAPGLPVRAYVAKAGLNSVHGIKLSTFAYFGGYVGDGNISQKIVLPDDAVPIEVYMELDCGQNFSLYVNGVSCGSYTPSGEGTGANIKETVGCYSDFRPGTNLIEIKYSAPGNNSLGGGYIKVTYDTSNPESVQGYKVEWLPGINGIINLYSGFYVPGVLESITAYLHYSSNNTVFLNIGNASVYSHTGTGEQSYMITSSEILSGLSAQDIEFEDLSERTIPFRFGTSNILLGAGSADTVINTDNTEHISSYLSDVKREDIDLMNLVLNNSNNRVGLVNYRTIDPGCYNPSEGIGLVNHSNLSRDNQSMAAQINGYTAPPGCCGPAISKAINKSADILANQSDCSKSRVIVLMSSPCGNDLSVYAPEEAYVQDDGVNWSAGINGQAFDLDGIDDYIDITRPDEWDTHSDTNLTVEVWIKLSGDMPDYSWVNILGDSYGPAIELYKYESGMYSIAWFEEGIGVYSDLRPLDADRWYYLVATRDYSGTANLYLNGTLIYSEYDSFFDSYPDFVGIGADEYGEYFKGAIDEVRIYDRSLNGPEVLSSFNRGLSGLKNNITDGLKAAWDMDGSAVDSTGHGFNGTVMGGNKLGWAVEAADSACSRLRCSDSNVSIFTIAFGVSGSDSSTLQEVARRCGNGSYYIADNIAQLEDVYEDIANRIRTLEYASQEAIAPTVVNDTLYPDSYLRFDYAPSAATVQYGEVPMDLETAEFGNSVTTGYFHVPNASRPIDARVVSYSGPYWTKQVKSLDSSGEWQNAFMLESYGQDYSLLGDPYSIYIPNSMIRQGINNVSISIGNSTGLIGGSPDDKAFYKVLIPAAVSMGEPLETNEGCNWTVEFYDQSTQAISAPADYSGIEKCSYTNASITYDKRSALNDAAYRLFRQFDISPVDGRLDIKFDPSSIEADSGIVGGVGSMWGPAEVKLVIWMK